MSGGLPSSSSSLSGMADESRRGGAGDDDGGADSPDGGVYRPFAPGGGSRRFPSAPGEEDERAAVADPGNRKRA